MTDKLTDNRLEQAIEKAVNLEPIDFCGVMCKFTNEIINRLQEENERLENNLEAMAVTMRNSAKATRAEARKEFAERLHEYINGIIERHEMPMFPFSIAFVSGIETKVDNLLKEMESEQ